MVQQPIGVFDSGIGGTSIWLEIVKRLPFENTLYLADSKNAPYGEKSIDEVVALSIKNTQFLIKNGAKIIVVGCNTATTNAIKVLREKFDIPFVGIEPAIKPATLQSKTNVVGILATRATLQSKLYQETAYKYAASGVQILEQEGTGLVPLIEANKINTPEMRSLLEQYLQPMMAQNIDHLVLGCSHYPYLRSEIKSIVGNGVQILDSGEAVARQTEKILSEHQWLKQDGVLGKHLLLTNKNAEVLEQIITHKTNVTIRYAEF